MDVKPKQNNLKNCSSISKNKKDIKNDKTNSIIDQETLNLYKNHDEAC